MLNVHADQAHSDSTAKSSKSLKILSQTYNSLLNTILPAGAGYGAVMLYGATLDSEHAEEYKEAAVIAGMGMAIFGSILKIFANHTNKEEPLYLQAWNSVIGILKKDVFLLAFLEFTIAEAQHDTGKNQDNDNGSVVLFAGVAALALTVAILSNENVKNFITKCCNKNSEHQSHGVGRKIWDGLSGFIHGASLMHTVVEVIEGFFISPFKLASQIPRWTLTAVYGIYKSISESGLLDSIIGKARRQPNSEELPLVRQQEQEGTRVSREEVENFIEKNAAGFALLVKLIEGMKETSPQALLLTGAPLLLLKYYEIVTNNRATPSSYTAVNNHLAADTNASTNSLNDNSSNCHFSPVTAWKKATGALRDCCSKDKELTSLPENTDFASDDYDDEDPVLLKDNQIKKTCCL